MSIKKSHSKYGESFRTHTVFPEYASYRKSHSNISANRRLHGKEIYGDYSASSRWMRRGVLSEQRENAEDERTICIENLATRSKRENSLGKASSPSACFPVDDAISSTTWTVENDGTDDGERMGRETGTDDEGMEREYTRII